MAKDASYHKAAIKYNESLAEAASKLAETLEHEVIKRWCRGVARQHRFHAMKHKKLLNRMENKKMNEKKAVVETNDIAGGGGSADPEDNLSVEEQQRRFAERMENQGSDDDPTETPAPVDPAPAAPPVESSPDPEQAAEPADGGAGVPDVETTEDVIRFDQKQEASV